MKRYLPNLGNACVLAGVALLGFGFWLPYATGDRLHRIENRAIRVASTMLRLADQDPGLNLDDAAVRRDLGDRLNQALDLTDPTSSLYIQIDESIRGDAESALFLRGKRYLYCLTRTPARYLEGRKEIESPGRDDQGKPIRRQITQAGSHRPFEVYAWPASKLVGVQAVFFFHTGARPAYFRNLSNTYMAAAQPPRPGAGRLKSSSSHDVHGYRGHDDERWLYRGVRPQ